MLISRISPFTNEMHWADLPVTQEQIDRWLAGELIQNVMPHLSADEREFMMTGITPEEWNTVFGGDE